MADPNIRGLTLIRPWAWAVAHAGKDIENRTWHPPRWLIGAHLAIHAGVKWDEAGASFIARVTGLPPPDRAADSSGVIVAVARLVGVDDGTSASPWYVGPVGWRLAGIVPLPAPVPCKGALGLWSLPAKVLAEVRRGWLAAPRGGP